MSTYVFVYFHMPVASGQSAKGGNGTYGRTILSLTLFLGQLRGIFNRQTNNSRRTENVPHTYATDVLF